MKQLLSAALLVALVPAAPALAAPAASATQDAALRAKALVLAKVLNDQDVLLETVPAAFSKGMRAAADADPMAKQLEAHYPGFLEELGRTVLPGFTRLLVAKLPDLWQRSADLFARRLTLAEMDKAIAFYGSPTGKNVVRAMSGTMDAGALVRDMQDDGKVEQGSMMSTILGAAPGALQALSAADRRVVMDFSYSPVGQKMGSLLPEITRIGAEWGTALATDPAYQAEVARTAAELMQRRTAGKPQ